MTASILAEWDNFYVITGSSAAGLTGLTFVVIALSAESKRVNTRGLRAYVTPTIVHFGALLIWRKPALSMYGVGAASVFLMFIGIHNAWDVAVWNSVRREKSSTE